MKNSIIIKEYTMYNENEIVSIYQAVGWTNYTRHPAMLRKAFDKSLKILGVYDKDKLIGIIRIVGDGASILYIQDILIVPEYQHQGVGTLLLHKIQELYPDVYQKVAITDSQENTGSFYRSVGFCQTSDFGCTAFLQYNPYYNYKD